MSEKSRMTVSAYRCGMSVLPLKSGPEQQLCTNTGHRGIGNNPITPHHLGSQHFRRSCLGNMTSACSFALGLLDRDYRKVLVSVPR
jgi:hypothetical protein